MLALIFSSGCAKLHYRAPANSPGSPLFVYQGRYLSEAAGVAGLKASSYLYAGDYRAVEQVLSRQPLSEQSLFLLNRARLALGKEPVGLMAGYKPSPLLEGLKGFYLAKLGYLKGAEEILRKNIPEVKTNREILELGLAAVLAKQGRNTEARQVLDAVMSRAPGLPDLKVLEGDLALNEGDFSTAWKSYSEAKALGHLKDDPVFATKLGLAALGAGQEIQGLAEEIRSLDPGSGLADYLEAQRSLHSGDLAMARNSLAVALTKKLPQQVQSEAETLARELESRLNAEQAIQAVIASPN